MINVVVTAQFIYFAEEVEFHDKVITLGKVQTPIDQKTVPDIQFIHIPYNQVIEITEAQDWGSAFNRANAAATTIKNQTSVQPIQAA